MNSCKSQCICRVHLLKITKVFEIRVKEYRLPERHLIIFVDNNVDIHKFTKCHLKKVNVNPSSTDFTIFLCDLTQSVNRNTC